MSEPLQTGIKRIIWIASDKKHHCVCDNWYKGHGLKFKDWKACFDKNYYYITKDEVWL